jgi:poly(3-hydroxybutyrate) depolymerase
MRVFIKLIPLLLPVFASAANTPPKVDAGPAERVVYPSSTSTTLHGSASDKEGPVTIQWKQVTGNSEAVIEHPTKAITDVSNLSPGLYTFVLKVTDNSGTSRTDTTTVSVLKKMTWTVEGTTREALVHPPSGGSGASPIIFAFHGHGGTDSGFAEKGFELSWPEAIVVYPQGLPTIRSMGSKCLQSGWQHIVGETNCSNGIVDQDITFFDTMLNTLKRKFNADSNFVFVHGWSNGGEFVYDVLWTARADKLAALAPAADTLHTINGKEPIPVIQIGGKSDSLVPFNEQQHDVREDRTLNQCSSTGTTWATGPDKLLATHYASHINAPVVFLQYNGGHTYPSTVPPLIMKFFKEVGASKTTAITSVSKHVNSLAK